MNERRPFQCLLPNQSFYQIILGGMFDWKRGRWAISSVADDDFIDEEISLGCHSRRKSGERPALDGPVVQLRCHATSLVPFRSRTVRHDRPALYGRPLMRAYIATSAPFDDHLEFFSIKVPDGPLTSRLQHLLVDDTLLVGGKVTGTLLSDNLLPGRNLFLLGTGTGFAPFASIVRTPETYARFERVIVVHGCRQVAELDYSAHVVDELRNNEFMGELAKEHLLYYPTATREPFRNQVNGSPIVCQTVH